ncbi:MAG: outer membrane protein assembly factor BamD [Bacteroidetes bacterium]|nr:outer membrane protein assembly factor BamD [Bacteroidota bacterium]
MVGRLVLILSVVALASCGDYNKVFKSKNAHLKFEKAVELYQKKDFARALPLFEQLRDIYRNSDSLETVYYYTAYSHFGTGDYEYASMYFKDFTENFSNSRKLVECAYMAVYCDFLSVGDPELDQSQTYKIIGALQTFINYYPETAYAGKCNDHIDALRRKLQQKEYNIVIQYFRMGDYRATVVSAKNTIKSFPDLEQKEELEYLAVKAQLLYAINSIEKKKGARLGEAAELVKDYLYTNGTTGKHYKDVIALKEKINNEQNKLNENI